MKDGTLIGTKRENYTLEENDKDIIIIYSGQQATITGKISNNSEDELPGLRIFKISSDDCIK